MCSQLAAPHRSTGAPVRSGERSAREQATPALRNTKQTAAETQTGRPDPSPRPRLAEAALEQSGHDATVERTPGELPQPAQGLRSAKPPTTTTGQQLRSRSPRGGIGPDREPLHPARPASVSPPWTNRRIAPAETPRSLPLHETLPPSFARLRHPTCRFLLPPEESLCPPGMRPIESEYPCASRTAPPRSRSFGGRHPAGRLREGSSWSRTTRSGTKPADSLGAVVASAQVTCHEQAADILDGFGEPLSVGRRWDIEKIR